MTIYELGEKVTVMVIDSGNISNILRTYNKQIKYGKISSIMDRPSSSDKLDLSPEAKKAMFISRLVSEIDGEVDLKLVYEKLSNYNFSKLSEEELNELKDKLLKELVG
ncbi:MAG: hypothetical protein N3C60_08915 [Calditerrivibrio sp.]|nr:hypothetical protein [Calditerrivibrio sp.]